MGRSGEQENDVNALGTYDAPGGLHLKQLAFLYADTKITQLHVSVIIQQHVGALHVRMDHSGSVEEPEALNTLPELWCERVVLGDRV